MAEQINLKEIERKAFRSMHQDGLWDIYIGGTVLSMSVMAKSLNSDTLPVGSFVIFILGILLSLLVFQGGKKYITTPRMGQVIFSPRRKRRKLVMVLALSGIVFIQLLILAGSILLWQNPQWAENIGLANTAPNQEKLLVSVIAALFVGPTIILISYFNENMRGYYIAFVMSLAVFSLIWFGEPLYLIIAGGFILIPGVFLFVRFLRKYPLPQNEDPNGG